LLSCGNTPPSGNPPLTFDVVLGPRAIDDLAALFDWIAEHASFDVADGYLARIEAACARLAEIPQRGVPRDDLAPRLRTIAFERRAVIVYSVSGRTVTILRVLYGGQDTERAFSAP